MNLLILTIGAPGAGKSTWINNNYLREYTLEPDRLRTLFGSISTDVNGEKYISMKNDRNVWKLLFNLLEKRMKNGELTVIDATHSSNKMINTYKNLADKYRYRVIAIDFRNIKIENVLEQNRNRKTMKIVPENEIKRIYERAKTMELPGWLKVYPHTITIDKIRKDFEKVFDYNQQLPDIKQINIFGDIHGCFNEFQKLYKKTRENKYKENEIIDIFLGDYFDRFHTKEELFKMFEFLDEKENAILLMGNHENYFHLLKKYEQLREKIDVDEQIKKLQSLAKDLELKIIKETDEIKKNRLSKKFDKTIAKLYKIKNEKTEAEKEYNEIIRKNIPVKTRQTLYELTNKYGHKRIRKFFRKLINYSVFNFGNNKYFICHGGFPYIPTIFDKTSELIKGVGDYGDEEAVIKTFSENTDKNNYLIFGHRDVFEIKNSLLPKYRGCILNGDAELNPEGSLKCLILTKDENNNVIHKYIEQKTMKKIDNISNVCKNKIQHLLEENIKILNEKGIIFTAKRHKFIDLKLIKKTETYDIFAVNFTRKAFRKGIWDSLSVHARGLFILKNKKTGEEKILSRGYHKFFNINEREETKIENLKKLKYPLLVFEKANGYLGLLSAYIDPVTKEKRFFISSKTSVEGEYAKTFENIIKPYLNEKVKEFLINNNVTAVFEVIEPEFDPHIQEYKEKELVFLNLIKNEMNFKLLLDKEDEFVNLFNKPNIIRKVKKIKILNNYKELIEYIKELNSVSLFEKNYIEGVVIREKGESPFMFKLKTDWYKFWKGNRTVKDAVYKKIQQPILKGQDKELIIKREIQKYKNYGSYEYQKFINFLIMKIKNDEIINKNIIELRKEFLKRENIKK